MPRPYDLIIVGGGLTGTLMALFFSTYRPEVHFMLIEAGESCGGASLETALLHEIPEKLRPIIDGAIVKEWDHYHIAYPTGSERREERVIMIDPMQLHLEAIHRLSREDLRLNSEIIEIAGETVKHSSGTDIARTIIDARENETLHSLNVLIASQNIDFDCEHGLEAPVLADFSLADEEWLLKQYFPVDPTKMLVRHIGPSIHKAFEQGKQVSIYTNEIVEFTAIEPDLGDNYTLADLNIIPSRLQLSIKLATALTGSAWLDMKTVEQLVKEIQSETAAKNEKFIQWVVDQNTAF